MSGRRIVHAHDDGSWNAPYLRAGEVSFDLDLTDAGKAWARALAVALFAIDPGSEQSAWVALNAEGKPLVWDKSPNVDLLAGIRSGMVGDEHLVALAGVPVVVEWMTPRGMPTSAQELETCYWVGRYVEALAVETGVAAARLSREAVKRHHIGATRPKGGPSADSRIRQVLIDRFGGVGGKEAAIGRKASPGPLYGLTADCWAALALGIAWQEGAR